MILLGLLSILQIAILPGLLLLQLLPFRRNLFQSVSYVYILSFLANYCLACLLTWFGIFQTSSLYCILALEICAIFYLFYRTPLNASVPFIRFNPVNLLSRTVITHLFAFLGIGTALIFLWHSWKIAGTIFSHQDEIGSYNNWATQWAENRMPNPFDTMGYPVSISANWATGYLILKDPTIQFFVRYASAFFPFVASLSFFALSVYRKNWIPLLSGFLFFILLKAYTPEFIGAGPLDVVIGCIGLAVYVAAIDWKDDPTNLYKLILLQLLAASAAALKQSGLFLSIIVTLYSIIVLFFTPMKSSDKRIRYLWVTLLFSILSLSWYLRIQYFIYQGLATSESAYLMKGIHGGLSYEERFVKAFHILTIGNPLILGFTPKMILLLGLGIGAVWAIFTERSAKLIFSIIVVPYFFLWAFFFSYEPRTLAPIFPFFALVSATGFAGMLSIIIKSKSEIQWSDQNISKRSISVVIIFICIIMFTPILTKLGIHQESLQIEQQRLQSKIIDPELNQKIYAQNLVSPFQGKIASIYGTLKFLPSLSKHYFQLRAPASLDLILYLEDREDIFYLLISTEEGFTTYSFPLTEPEAISHIKNRLAEGRYKLLFQHKNLALIKIRQ